MVIIYLRTRAVYVYVPKITCLTSRLNNDNLTVVKICNLCVVISQWAHEKIFNTIKHTKIIKCLIEFQVLRSLKFYYGTEICAVI